MNSMRPSQSPLDRWLAGWISERRRWQRQTRESLIVTLASVPEGPSAARTALELGRALDHVEGRRPTREVLLFELDFWAPTLAGHLGLKADREERDLFSSFLDVAQDRELQQSLRRDQGLVHSHADLERWIERLRPLLPPAVADGDHLLICPAACDAAAFERSKSQPPTRLVSYPAEPVALPGVAVFRLLLTAAAQEQQAGIVLLTLPSGWNPASLLAMGSLADVLILLRRGLPFEDAAMRGLEEFLSIRRQQVINRPEFEENLMLIIGEPGATRAANEATSETATAGSLPFAQERWIERTDTGNLDPGSLRALASELNDRAASKAAEGVELELVTDPTAADRALLSELQLQSENKRQLRILVEDGPYGEYPVKRLVQSTRREFAGLGEGGGGFGIEPHPITHSELLADLSDPTALRAKLEEKGVELLTFPHYMLGALVEANMLLPWHVLEDALSDGASPALDEARIERWFYQVSEICRYNGVLYAVPYSLLQKLLLIKKGSDLISATHRWQNLAAQLVEIGTADHAWPLLLETELEHVGIWYDWCEFVHAFGGADFRQSGRGSDYGECWINHPQTVAATVFYLDLLIRTERRVGRPINWDELLDLFLQDDDSQLTIAWSDIVAYHWRRPTTEQRATLPEKELPIGLEDRVEARSFPLGDDLGRTSIEGWVLAAPSWLAPERRRLVGQVIAWFLSAAVQRRYAEHGGNTARRDVGHALSDVQKLIHRSILSPLRRPALKATFREAPQVIQSMGRAFEAWIKPLLRNGEPPDREVIANQLDQLARHVTQDLLRNQARYRPPAYWSQQGLEDAS